jgi:hypothetical protein
MPRYLHGNKTIHDASIPAWKSNCSRGLDTCAEIKLFTRPRYLRGNQTVHEASIPARKFNYSRGLDTCTKGKLLEIILIVAEPEPQAWSHIILVELKPQRDAAPTPASARFKKSWLAKMMRLGKH